LSSHSDLYNQTLPSCFWKHSDIWLILTCRSKAQASAKLAKIMDDIDAMLERSDSEKETAEGDDSAGSESDANIVEDNDDDDDF